MNKEAGEILVEEIFSDECKGLKNRLLLISSASLAIIKGGFLPQSISALGISLTINNIKYIVFLLLFICIYFFLSFILKVVTDIIHWRMNFYASISKTFREQGMITGEETEGKLNVPGHNDKIDGFMNKIKINNFVRLIFDIGVPTIFVIFTIVVIIIYLV